LLHAGDVYRVPDTPGYTARVGNNAALTVVVDGHDVSLPLGNSRVQNIVLDPVSLLAGTGEAATVPAASHAVSQ
jgi:RodZ C-terminal domain